MLIKALIGVSAFALLSTGAAAYFRMDAQLQKQKAEILEESNDALRADLRAHTAAAEAYSKAISDQSAAARAAARALENARNADATLDACLSYNPRIDLTGGLLNLNQNAVPTGP